MFIFSLDFPGSPVENARISLNREADVALAFPTHSIPDETHVFPSIEFCDTDVWKLKNVNSITQICMNYLTRVSFRIPIIQLLFD
jgi:hypothetical protein